jgi:DNA-directed RNA polymerase III subunit RPC8
MSLASCELRVRCEKMFLLELVEDTIRLPPDRLNDQKDMLEQHIQRKYVNGVLRDKGLVVALYDIVSVGDAHIFQGDGAPWLKTSFRLIVFRPKKGTLLSGAIVGQSEKGIRVSLNFFDDIVVPAANFRRDCHFDEHEQIWCWKYKEYDMWFEGTRIMLRVTDVQFSTPEQSSLLTPPRSQHAPASLRDAKSESSSSSASSSSSEAGAAGSCKSNSAASLAPAIPPCLAHRTDVVASPSLMTVFGSVAEDGLGMEDWWK